MKYIEKKDSIIHSIISLPVHWFSMLQVSQIRRTCCEKTLSSNDSKVLSYLDKPRDSLHSRRSYCEKINNLQTTKNKKHYESLWHRYSITIYDTIPDHTQCNISFIDRSTPSCVSRVFLRGYLGFPPFLKPTSRRATSYLFWNTVECRPPWMKIEYKGEIANRILRDNVQKRNIE